MAIKFLGLKNDAQAYFSLNILRELGQEVLILENEDQALQTWPEDKEILVGIFTTPNPKLLSRGHLSRIASHRIMAHAPLWTDSCHFLIAVRSSFYKKSRPKDMCKEWIKTVSNLEAVDLSKSTPWGSLPTAPGNFKLYREWISDRLHQDPQKLGIQFIAPIHNLSGPEIKQIRNVLRAHKDKQLIDHVIKLAQTTDNPVSIEKIIRTGSELIIMTNKKRLLIESGLHFELMLDCFWKALSGQPLIIIAPLCPAWTHDENGYTFCGLEENSKGVCYDMMSPELDYFLEFLRNLGIDHRLLGWIADIEFLDLEAEVFSFAEKSLDKHAFLARIKKQARLIQSDLDSRGIRAEVKPFMEIVAEEQYTIEEARERQTYQRLLETLPAARKHFSNTLKLEAPLYQKQCGFPVDPINPHPKIKDALIRDMTSHLTPLKLLRKLHAQSNHMFFLQSGPFTQLYKGVPYVAWRGRQGAF